MRIHLKYGTKGLDLALPETPQFQGVLYPRDAPPLPDANGTLTQALAHPIATAPLAELALGRKDAAIAISDSTRPVPNALLLPAITTELEEAGIAPEAITILIATGIHRPNEEAELESQVGAEIARRYRILNHFSKRDEKMVQVGTIVDGVPALVNRHYVQAELKILTGFIEPHMWAGFSGGDARRSCRGSPR